jgi:hypothetical protein
LRVKERNDDRPRSACAWQLSERSSTMSDFLFVILLILKATEDSEPVVVILD